MNAFNDWYPLIIEIFDPCGSNRTKLHDVILNLKTSMFNQDTFGKNFFCLFKNVMAFRSSC